jgi:N-acyl-D-amino-acid deacylase
MFDIKITGGNIVDGTGTPPYRADIGICGGIITEIESSITGEDAHCIIDATGKMVCPGFIDVHSHSDVSVLLEPSAVSKISQGVTTEVVGNCGASAAPIKTLDQLPSDWRCYKYASEWKSMADYRMLLENIKPIVNIVPLVGHNTLRRSVAGETGRILSDNELSEMLYLFEQSMAEGAKGFSTGLIYPPGMFAPSEELIAMAKIAAKYDGIYTTHMRNEGKGLIESIKETISIAEAAGVRVEISHLKTAGKSNWHLLETALDYIHSARERGVNVCADRYPYISSHTDLDSILPAWTKERGNNIELSYIREPSTRKRIKEELVKSRGDDYWTTVTIASTYHPELGGFRGISLVDAARKLNMPPVDAVLYILERDELRTGAFFAGMSEENMKRILAEKYVMIGSDSASRSPDGLLGGDFPHPRAYGTFPRFIRMVLDGMINISFAEAIHKMTLLPAMHFQIPRRGQIKCGYFADITVIDPTSISDMATYAEPWKLSTGIEYVIVNGQISFSHGKLTDIRAGMVL